MIVISTTVNLALRFAPNVRRSLHRVPACPVQVTPHRPCRVKTAQEEGLGEEGALALVLTGRVKLSFLHGRHTVLVMTYF
jgi:hypothetical protein